MVGGVARLGRGIYLLGLADVSKQAGGAAMSCDLHGHPCPALVADGERELLEPSSQRRRPTYSTMSSSPGDCRHFSRGCCSSLVLSSRTSNAPRPRHRAARVPISEGSHSGTHDPAPGVPHSPTPANQRAQPPTEPGPRAALQLKKSGTLRLVVNAFLR
ncbi:hypothetical protein BV25DRAFT_1136850 [Artomyces pyxidatus]|uniref:Uncharacterized protein n=1 Tax=Artomyces pyxidatus TaxID=48021 RepID=A0ACB8SSV8_9AGAM|nr:hypothetical protein BV25DRAFT_1136850 [Artomyces pyxidatus]